MDEQRTFVGRQAELNRFREILQDPQGQAIVVVGQAGMGKTWLLDRMAYMATQHPSLRCGWVRYEVTPTDSPDSTMALMMDHAFEAAQTSEGSFDKTARRRKQWAALFKVVVPKGKELAELRDSLRRDPQRHTREQFIDRLHLISKRMPDRGRALFVIDPDKYMCKGCADSWRLVVRELPEKTKLLFAQRPEDELISNNSFMASDNVVRLPDEALDILAPEDVEELVRLRTDEIGHRGRTLRDAMARYEGHPYAIQAAMEIVKRTQRIEDLPQDPTNEGIAATQWQQVCRTADAIRLFEAYAILEVAVPRDIVQAVSDLDTPTMKRLLSDSYLRGLLRDEGQGRRIYHAILADHVRGQIRPPEQQALHARAILAYRTSLKEAREQHRAPDAVAAVRLPEHVLDAEGPDAFVDAFIDECTAPLLNLGLLDTAIDLSVRSLQLAKERMGKEGAVLGNLAVIHQTRGDLDKAEKMFAKALEIGKYSGQLKGVANQYANLGLIHQARGHLDNAERMLRKSLEINERLAHLEGMASQYANLGLICRRRGDLEEAEKMFRKALDIDKKLGRPEGMANQYANLGLVNRTRGNLDQAERMHMRALEIDEKLGRLEGIASDYGNLSVIHQMRGDLNTADRMLRKALEIEQKLGRLEGIANVQNNLGLIYLKQGNLVEAEKTLRMALETNERIGRPEGIAMQYGNLGLVHQARGKLVEAENMHKKSLEINQKLGLVEGIAQSHAQLGLICQKRGDLREARAHWQDALALLQRIQAKDQMRITRAWIDDLPKTGR